MPEAISLYRQPKGLYLLFSTELWERFGFYTIQAILILYMTKGLGYEDHKANLLYAVYSALLYVTPILGGYMADRFLGFQRAIMIGGALSAVGYLCTAIPNETSFFVGLSILMCANGLFKPNVSSIVGDLYAPGDPRRDGGFTLFYMGINIGALVPPLIAGTLTEHYGWHSGFLLAAAGMILGLVIFSLGRKRLPLAGKIPLISPLNQSKSAKIRFEILFYLGFIIAVLLCMLAFHYPQATAWLTEAAAVVITLIVVYFMYKEPKAHRNKMWASLILTAISIGFWALYNQTFTSLTLFADRNMEQYFLGIPVNASTMQFFNPLFIILLSPILSSLWVKLSRQHINPGFALKFALGVAFVTLGFLILPLGIKFTAHAGIISAWWLVISYLLQTLGELLLSPVGLSMITVLTPKRLVGMMMGVWFFAQAASFALGGTLANLAAAPENVDKMTSLTIYNHAFLLFGLFSLALTVISFLLIPFLKRLIGQLPHDRTA
ncbi:MAG TPA: oligopeptide:H+ symporter [Gammaproteobacteria bacterium]|nr:oligopeptide:H+ symporter [Gammaproteobacteria bacterium]